MSNSFDSYLPNIGNVKVEQVLKENVLQTPAGVQLNDNKFNHREMMDDRQVGNDDCSEDSNGDVSENGRRKKLIPMRAEDIEEIRTEGSADDMDLDETIDSHIGVRMESERQHIQSFPSDDNEEEEDDEDDDIGIDSVNILDTLPLEGAPIEGQEVSEADLLGKINDEDDEDEDKSLSRSGEEDSLDVGKRHTDHEDDLDPAKKKQKKDDGSEGPELESKADKKLSNMRRNIREVMDETQLDEATLSAQRQEMERLRRVQEQQRVIREVRLPNTVMLKVNSGSAAGSQASVGQQSGIAPRRPLAEGSRWQRGGRVGGYQGSQTSISRVPARATTPNVLQQRIRMMTPSVSISPVIPKKEPIEHLEYYTDSDLSDVDAEAEEALLHEKQMQQARKLSGVSKSGQKLGKGKDVVTISSSSESSDDDCIVLSDPSEVEETDNEDDPSNSGMHTNDRYNIPDEHGRVLVNVGHPDDEPDVFLAPQVARIIKPHQIGGIRFLYDNIVESIERFKTSSGFGCILAHSMGLGKTLQVASFCDIFFRCTTSKTVLCIMPINTLQNWLAEFNMWLPYEDVNKPKVEEKPPVKEESNQSDLSYMSRSGSEHDPSSQHQHPPTGMMPDNNPYASHGYNQNLMPHYGAGGTMFDPRYGPTYPGSTGYSPIKTEPSCLPQSMNSGMNPGISPYGLDNRGMSQYNPGYPANMQRPPTSYPGMDPNMHSSIHGMNPHATTPMYSGYGANSNMPYSSYGGQPRPENTDFKKMENSVGPEQHGESNQTTVKIEPTDEPKKESEEVKKEGTIDKKEETIKTPFSVDAPFDLEVRPRHFSLHILNDSHKTMAARARVIREWQKTGGVLLIGYELYRQLSLKKPNKAKRKRGQPPPFKDPTAELEEEDKNKPLLDEMHTALVNPGPDLVICDEGHRIKNSHASISLALKQMRTKRRIVLTGYPLQNNLLEYWCMVDFVRPNYLGTKSEFCNMFERPIQNGQCIDSTPQDIRLMRYRAHVLHALLEGFVQRRSHSVLQISLPRKEEYILLVRMTAHQRKLYDTFMNQVVKTRAVPNPLKAFAVCCKIWNHPDILYHFLRKRQANEEDDLDLEETMGEKTPNTPGAKRATKARQPKGEGRKGKKASTKNKPAASIQPNSTAMPNDTSEVDGEKVAQGFQNFNAPAPPQLPPPIVNNSSFAHSNSQGSYQQQQQQQQPQQQQQQQQVQQPQNQQPQQQQQQQQQPQQQQQQQQHGGYQNYRPEERSGGYHSTEYNDFYGNQQTQPKYSPTGNQAFPPYSQNSNYQPSNQSQRQQYQGQQQNYNIPSNDANAATASHGQRYPGTSPSPAPSTPNFRPDQNQSMVAPGNTGTFPRSNYPYQERDRNYQTNIGQGQNYSQVPSQQPSGFQSQNQTTNQIGISEYGGYPPANQNQGYNNAPTQPIQNQSMNYQSSSQPQTQNPNIGNTASSYIGNQQQQLSNPPSSNTSGFPQNQQLPGPAHQPYQNPPTQQNQNVPQPIQTQPLSYSVNQSGTPNPVPVSPGMVYNQNQQQQQQQQPQQHPYQTNMPQNQMRGYQNLPQNQAPNYGQSHITANSNQQTQPHVYPNDQQQQQQQQAQSQHGYNQQPPAFSPTTQQVPPGQIGYSSNQAGTATPSNQVPLSYQSTSQQNQASSLAQNQTLNYPQSHQPRGGKNIGQDDQQHGYPRQDSQNAQNLSSNYPVTPSTPHGFPPTNTQVPSGNQVPNTQQQPPVQGQDQFWQRNYQNCNDNYYNDTSVNQYQGNYSSNVAAPGNYQASQPSQQNQQNQYRDYSSNNMIDSKIPQVGAGSHLQNSVQSSNVNSVHNQQNQTLSQVNNVTPAAPTYNNPVNTMPGVGNTVLGNNQIVGETHKEDEKDNKEDLADKDKVPEKEKDKDDKSDEEVNPKDEAEKDKCSPGGLAGAMSNMKDDPGIPYDWATELMKGYMPGLIDASAKMTLFFCILDEAIRLGDRVLAFSQSLFTLNLIEDFLARNNFKYADGQTEAWLKNINYYRLDGSTSALEREKLINEFNVNPKVHLFLVSTRAGSLGINLVGANRAIVFDASWNPCHDTQAVCRVYRYGQQKNCYVYRLVTDNCLERKIYDRQISKQGMADRVVDQCNPDAHLSLKEATTLSWDWEEDSQVQDFSDSKDKYTDEVMHIVLDKHSSLLTKQPFHHESLLVDRKDKKLSQAEKRLARRGYELEKMAANCSRPSYNYVPGNTAARVSVSSGSLQIRQIRGDGSGPAPKPVASVRPMQQRGADGLSSRNPTGSRWIPAEVWQRQGMSAQEMTLPLDVVIPTNSPDKGSIVLKAGQRVMVLKSPKGIYMQLESGKIIAIRTALKINQQKKEDEPPKKSVTPAPRNNKSDVGFPLRNNSAISIIPKSSTSHGPSQQNRSIVRTGVNYRPFGEKEVAKRTKPVATATAKPYSSQFNTNQVSLSRISKPKQDNPNDIGSMGENSNSSDSHKVRTEQRVEEVRIEDVVAEAGSNSDYSPSSRPSNSDTDSNLQRPMTETKTGSNFPIDSSSVPPRPQQPMRPIQDRDCYLPEQKAIPPKKFDLGRTNTHIKDKKPDGSEDIIIEDGAQHQQQHPLQQQQHLTHQQHQQQHQPIHQPIPQHPHTGRTQSRVQQHPSNNGVPRVTSDIVLSGNKTTVTNTNLTSPPVTPAPPTTVAPSRTPKPSPTEPPPTSTGTHGEPAHAGLPQGYPYAQYPRYYDYGDPRTRPLTDPYSSYFPPTSLPTRPELGQTPQSPAPLKPVLPEETTKLPSVEPPVPTYSRGVGGVGGVSGVNALPLPVKTATTAPPPELSEPLPPKPVDPIPRSTTASASSVPAAIREEPHVPTAFSHPSSVRTAYPGPYPPAPYDPYSQHYPPAPASSAAYSPGAASGYPTYGGPSYNADYARMYSAFHGPPPPAADPYVHRSYAPPPATHPSNYYPPFPHPPPPPYPNYSFLPPYPNPNVPADPQPPPTQ